MKLGVFDSGIGGEAVALSLQAHFPNAYISTANDRKHLPYGNKTKNEIIQFTDAAIQPLLGNDVVVIACNSATTAAIDWLRIAYPDQHFVGIEPMVKTASIHTKSGVIAVCATPATLASERYQYLKQAHTDAMTVIEPDCSGWAQMIENSNIDEAAIKMQIETLLIQEADVIVLGCTHYNWIRGLIEDTAKEKAIILEPSGAIASRIRAILQL